MWIVSDDDKQ